MAIFPNSMPYDDVAIYDQSEYVETQETTPALTIPSGPVALCPFISPRGYGEDGKLLYMDSTRLAKYGTPNLKKYGLSLYLANRFLEGQGTVLGIRVTSDDARYANACIYAKIEKGTSPKYASAEKGVYPNVTQEYYPYWIAVNPADLNEYKETFYENIKMTNITNIESISDTTIPSVGSFGTESDSDYKIGNDYSTKDEATSNANNVLKDVKTFTFTESESQSLIIKAGSPLYLFKDKDSKIVLYYLVIEEDSERYTAVLKPWIKPSLEETYIASYHSVTLSNKKDIVSAFNGWELGGDDYVHIKNYDSTSPFEKTEKKESTTTTTPIKYYAPLFVVKAKASGEFANAFSFRLIADDTMNETVSEEAFFYKFIDSDNGNKLDEKMTFTFDDDYVYGTDCMSAEEVFSNYSENIELAKTDYFDDYMKLIDDVCCNTTNGTAINSNAKDSATKMDILFGTNTYANKYRVSLSGGNTINLSASEGISLKNGSDGWKNEPFDFDNDKFASALAEVYKGNVTDLIYDEVRYPYTYIFAPSYDSAVVNAIHDLVTNGRRITRANYFIPRTSTYSEARKWVADHMASISTFKETIVSEWGPVKDPYTNKKTYMPSVYFDALQMPYHWIKMPGKPYAGRSNYNWTGFTVGGLVPCSTNPNEYIANHNSGINIMCEDGLGYASPYEQITAQTKNKVSRLSEINNAITLCEMVRLALKIANDTRWTDLGNDEIANYKTSVEGSIATSLNGCYKTVTVFSERESVNGAGRNRIHCKINVLFKDMLKGVSYEFYILAN